MIFKSKRVIAPIVLLFLIALFFIIKSPKQKVSQNKIAEDCETKLKGAQVYELYQGTPKPIDFSSFSEAKLYYTRITESVKKGANFAGHFRLATWGCGTDCFGWALVNLNSGKIISYETANPNYHLRQTFDLNSKYFILDPLYAGEERRFYEIVSGESGEGSLEITCTEEAEMDYYISPEE